MSAVRDETTPSNDNFVEVISRRSWRLQNVQPSSDTPASHVSNQVSNSTEAQSISVIIGTGRAQTSNEPVSSGYAAACRRVPTASPSRTVIPDWSSQWSTPRIGLSRPGSHQTNSGTGQQRPNQVFPVTREAAHRPKSHPVLSRGPSTLVIGTSLVRGLGDKRSCIFIPRSSHPIHPKPYPAPSVMP